MKANAQGQYFQGLNNALKSTRIDDLPPCIDGFDAIAEAADAEMIASLVQDLERRQPR
jgi:hypothetical protein